MMKPQNPQKTVDLFSVFLSHIFDKVKNIFSTRIKKKSSRTKTPETQIFDN